MNKRIELGEYEMTALSYCHASFEHLRVLSGHRNSSIWIEEETMMKLRHYVFEKCKIVLEFEEKEKIKA